METGYPLIFRTCSPLNSTVWDIAKSGLPSAIITARFSAILQKQEVMSECICPWWLVGKIVS